MKIQQILSDIELIKNLGNLSDITTNSFYASHIINGAGSGGIACFNNYKLYQHAKLLRGGEDHQQLLMNQKKLKIDLMLRYLEFNMIKNTYFLNLVITFYLLKYLLHLLLSKLRN